MPDHSGKKPADPSKPNQPTLKELSSEELDRVTGGDKATTTTTSTTTTKPSLSDFHFTKVIDKSSPS